MIYPTWITQPNYNLTTQETITLITVINANPLKTHGIKQADTKLYRNLRSLTLKGLIAREGYKYAPTKWGWLHYTKLKETTLKKPETKQTLLF